VLRGLQESFLAAAVMAHNAVPERLHFLAANQGHDANRELEKTIANDPLVAPSEEDHLVHTGGMDLFNGVLNPRSFSGLSATCSTSLEKVLVADRERVPGL
jgi:hypothetical protein